MNRAGLRKEIVPLVGDKRMPHVLGTEEECLRLAGLFRLSETDTERLATAALLHDITKRLTTEEQLLFLSTRGMTVGEDTLRSEKTLHAVTGAELARERYPSLTDDAVFGAIRWHTTGRAGMTLLEKLLYLADYIEPTRRFEDCVKLRECFYARSGEEDLLPVLDDTLILSFDMTIGDLLRQRRPIHPDTVSARNELLAGRL